MKGIRVSRSERPAMAQFGPLLQLVGLLQSAIGLGFSPLSQGITLLMSLLSLATAFVNFWRLVLGLFGVVI